MLLISLLLVSLLYHPSLSFTSRTIQRPQITLFAKHDVKSNSNLLEELNEKFDYPDRIRTDEANTFRCGYVSLVGMPNMGKSTLMNALVEEELCAITPRPQTTRHSILGVLTTSETQVLFLDTPGIIEEPAYKLQSVMMDAVKSSLRSADIIVYVTSVTNDVETGEEMKYTLGKNVIVALNKVDLVGSDTMVQQKIREWRELFPDAIAVLPLAAKNPGDKGTRALKKILLGGDDVPAALRDVGRPYDGMFREDKKTVEDAEAKSLIPVGPALYGKEDLTDRNSRFLASEMIRQSIFSNLKKEVPYSCEVQVEQFSTSDKMLDVRAVIIVERESQKGIVIGKGGKQIKQVGIDARLSLQTFFETKVNLKLYVKVDANWRKDDDKLKEYGYINQKAD